MFLELSLGQDMSTAEAREKYEKLESLIERRKNELENYSTGEDSLDRIFDELDEAYDEHVANTHSPAIVQSDQQTFTKVSSVVGHRILNRNRASKSTLSVNSLVDGLNTFVRRQIIESENISELSTNETSLETRLKSGFSEHLKIANLFFRASLSLSHSNFIPSLSLIAPHEPVNRRQRILAPTSNQQTAEEENSEEMGETHQVKLQKLICKTVLDYENSNSKILPLDRLCFDTSFSNTIENYFTVCTLIKEQKLIVMHINGVPIIKSLHESRDESAPSLNETRHQVNFSLDYNLYTQLNDLLKNEEIMIKRA